MDTALRSRLAWLCDVIITERSNFSIEIFYLGVVILLLLKSLVNNIWNLIKFKDILIIHWNLMIRLIWNIFFWFNCLWFCLLCVIINIHFLFISLWRFLFFGFIFNLIANFGQIFTFLLDIVRFFYPSSHDHFTRINFSILGVLWNLHEYLPLPG